MKGIYIMGQYPDKENFKRCFTSIAQKGFDFIEIGIPFNDPIADGPVIARAALESLSHGAHVEDIINDIVEFKKMPIKKYIMTYSNIIYSYGIKNFSKPLKNIAESIILADLPNRMSQLFYTMGLTIPIIPFATLETRESDLELMNRSESEIIYFVGVRGITGSKANLTADEMVDKIKMIKDNTDKKVIIGFGIKTRDDVEQALSIADGFVIGTEAVKRQSDPDELDRYLDSLVD